MLSNLIEDPIISTTLSTLFQNEIPHKTYRHKTDLLWAIILGAVFVLVMSFGLAANSSSNAIACLTGSKTLPMKLALLLNICFQLAACFYVAFAGGQTEVQFILELATYDKHRANLLLGQVGMICGLSVWLLFVTYKKIPVSSGHSVVGSTIAYSVALDGFHAIKWEQISHIILSYIISPILSGFTSLAIFALIDYFILRKKNDVEKMHVALILLFAFSGGVNAFMVLQATVRDYGLFSIPLHLSFVASVTVGGIISLLVIFFIAPMLHEHIEEYEEEQVQKKLSREMPTIRIKRFKVKKISDSVQPSRFKLTVDGKTQIFNRIRKRGFQKFRCALVSFINKHFHIENRQHRVEIEYQFGIILLFNSCFFFFLQAVQNLRQSLIPLTMLLMSYRNINLKLIDRYPTSPILLWYTLPSICLGIYIWGSRATETMGNKLAKLYPVNAFVAQIGTIITLIISHHIHIPISTTHCFISSILAVGLVDNRENSLDWKATKQVIIYSVATLPATFLLVLFFSYLLHFAL